MRRRPSAQILWISGLHACRSSTSMRRLSSSSVRSAIWRCAGPLRSPISDDSCRRYPGSVLDPGRGKQQGGGCGLMHVMTTRQAAARRPRSGYKCSLDRKSERPPNTCKALAAFCKRRPAVAMVRYIDPARSLRPVAGRMPGVNSTICPGRSNPSPHRMESAWRQVVLKSQLSRWSRNNACRV